jgi:hypothetical protein
VQDQLIPCITVPSSRKTSQGFVLYFRQDRVFIDDGEQVIEQVQP